MKGANTGYVVYSIYAYTTWCMATLLLGGLPTGRFFGPSFEVEGVSVEAKGALQLYRSSA